MGSPDTLERAEQVLLDGANGVGRDPREHFPQALGSGALAAVAVVAAFVLLRRSARRWVSWALLAAALPGWAMVAWLRADAPLNRPRLAAAVERDLGQLQSAAPWPQTPVNVVREDDDVLFPLGRYALPSRPQAPANAVQLELVGSQLGAGCRADGAHVVCGASK